MRRQFPVAAHVDAAMVESVLLSGQNLVESILGREMREADFHFDYPAPTWREHYVEFFSGSVHFDAEFCGLGMPVGWRALPCPFADSGMYQAALSRLEMERRRLDSADFLVVRLAMLLEGAGDAGLDLETAAERMSLSRRTLIRRLKEAGTSFSALLDDHRRQRAQRLLAESNLTSAEVGYRLGYHEPANFTRAFKRWTGETPARYRQRRCG